jgi:osmotically inducible lipoprotein OsmB
MLTLGVNAAQPTRFRLTATNSRKVLSRNFSASLRVGALSRRPAPERGLAMRKILLCSAMALSLGACNSYQSDRALTGAAVGGAAGAVVGGVATGRPGGALAGAAIGAAGGAAVGAATAQPRCGYDAYGRWVCY